jgi:hypothetical protein
MQQNGFLFGQPFLSADWLRHDHEINWNPTLAKNPARNLNPNLIIRPLFFPPLRFWGKIRLSTRSIFPKSVRRENKGLIIRLPKPKPES